MDINDYLRQEVQIQRVATDLLKNGLFQSLDEAYAAIRAILLDAESITSATKLNKVEKAIAKAVKQALEDGWATYTDGMTDTAIYSAQWYSEQIGATMPGRAGIESYIESSMMSLSSGNLQKVGLWGEFVSKSILDTIEQINNTVRSGYIYGATVQQTIKNIKVFNDGLAKHRIETLARTGLAHYAQQARNAMALDNADIISKEVPLVTFDNRTSSKCIGIDTKYHDGWPLGESPIGYPPFHPNCRTQIIYWLDGEDDPRKDLKRTAIGSGDNYESGDKYKGRKNIKDGEFVIQRVDAGDTFEQWISKQDKAFIEDVLGKTKARLFMQGKLPLSKMSDAYGNPLTLAQLKAANAAAFEAAGIE